MRRGKKKKKKKKKKNTHRNEFREARLVTRANQQRMSSSNRFIQGIYPALFTPLHADLTVNVPELSRHANELIDRGCQGVVLFGTSGEGPSFTVPEKLGVYSQIISGDKAIPVSKALLGNGAASLFETIELVKAGLELGCPGFLICPPYFFKGIADQGVIDYYRQLIKHTTSLDTPSKLKIILYH